MFLECFCTFSLKIFGFEAFRAISVDSSRNQVFAERVERTKYDLVSVVNCREHVLRESIASNFVILHVFAQNLSDYLELGDKLCCKMTVVASRIRQT